MRKWTHNTTGRDYFEVGNGPFSAENCRVNDLDFIVAVETPTGVLKVYPQDMFKMEKHRGATLHYGRMQCADPVTLGEELRGYNSLQDGSFWCRPIKEWDARFTCILEMQDMKPRKPDLAK